MLLNRMVTLFKALWGTEPTYPTGRWSLQEEKKRGRDWNMHVHLFSQTAVR
jgi:hypothetical protein